MKNKFKLFLTFNYILIFSHNILLPIDINPDKVTQMQIKSIQEQLKNQALSDEEMKTNFENTADPENLVKMDYKGGLI